MNMENFRPDESEVVTPQEKFDQQLKSLDIELAEAEANFKSSSG